MASSRKQLAFAVLAGLALAVPGEAPAFGQVQEKPACEQFDWSIKREQELFGSPALSTVSSGTKLEKPLGQGVALQLLPNASVPFVLPPARQPKTPDSFGGVITFVNVPKPGLYEVTLSSEAWIDVVQSGKALESTAHSGKRGCADVRKSVRFELQPSEVTIQVSGAPANQIKLAVLPAE